MKLYLVLVFVICCIYTSLANDAKKAEYYAEQSLKLAKQLDQKCTIQQNRAINTALNEFNAARLSSWLRILAEAIFSFNFIQNGFVVAKLSRNAYGTATSLNDLCNTLKLFATSKVRINSGCEKCEKQKFKLLKEWSETPNTVASPTTTLVIQIIHKITTSNGQTLPMKIKQMKRLTEAFEKCISLAKATDMNLKGNITVLQNLVKTVRSDPVASAQYSMVCDRLLKNNYLSSIKALPATFKNLLLTFEMPMLTQKEPTHMQYLGLQL